MSEHLDPIAQSNLKHIVTGIPHQYFRLTAACQLSEVEVIACLQLPLLPLVADTKRKGQVATVNVAFDIFVSTVLQYSPCADRS